MSPVTRSAPSLTRMPFRTALGALAASMIAVLAGAALPAGAAVLEPAPGDTVVVDLPFRADGEQHEWVVPDGVTEITVELAAGSGASQTSGAEQSVGGAGGHLVARIPVTPLSTLHLLIGGRGTLGSEPIVGGNGGGVVAPRGGGATVLAGGAEILAVAGGGGAGYACGSGSVTCADGGAGGYSATATGPSAGAGEETTPYSDFPVAGTGATSEGPGVSRGEASISVSRLDGEDTVTFAEVDAANEQPGTLPAGVNNGVIGVAVGAAGLTSRDAGGGSGYFGGGHGAVALVDVIGETTSTSDSYTGGGGGGSGYLVEGAEIVDLHDNVGDGFASISYLVPEPEVVADPEPELVDTTEPTLTVSEATVRAGTALDLAGTGLDPDRAYPVILNSDPVLLGEVTTDAQGVFATTVTIPASVHAGEHVITVGEASIPITVLAAEVVPQPRMVPPAPGLAATGTADDLEAAGLAALTLLGVGALALRRVRQTQHVE